MREMKLGIGVTNSHALNFSSRMQSEQSEPLLMLFEIS